jgi:hypothetical protein
MTCRVLKLHFKQYTEVELVNNIRRRRPLGLGFGIVAFLILWSMSAEKCSAFEMALPSIGTNINYDFSSQTPVFVIANAALTQEVLESEVTFTNNKHLNYSAEAELHLIHIDLTLRAPQINSLFEGTYISFDEKLSLVRADGSIAAMAENSAVSSVGDCGSYCDVFTFGWDFHLSDFSFHGFEWTITPDLLQGVDLPETITVETYMWAAGSITVVPEPASAVSATILLVCVTAVSRSLTNHYQPH